MKPHEFQYAARQFRAGKISLNEFTHQVFAPDRPRSQAQDQAAASPQTLLEQLAERPADSHKGDYGRILVLAGSPGMAGAAALTGIAALRSGAGLVTVATPVECQPTVAAAHPALMTVGLPADDGNDAPVTRLAELDQRVPRYDCIAVGPGLGTRPATRRLVRDIVRNTRVPLVVDADGINGLPSDFAESAQPQKIVLTPHPGELQRLMPDPSGDRQRQKEFASQLATAMQGVVVLKGHQTFVTGPNRQYVNSTGNPGMATAGSGDVLTGIIAGLIGQGLSLDEASVLGCYWHGKAGDIAAEKLSRISLLATDIIEALPRATVRR